MPAIPARATLTRPARVVLATLLALVAGGAGVVATGSGAAAEDVTWTVRTASNDFGADRTGFAYSIEPGASVDDALVVANHGDEALDFAVYAADGYTTDSGQFDLLTSDAESTGIGAWLRTGTDAVTVAPGQTVELPFTVAVPQDATPGDYAGGVLTSLVQQDQSAGITVDRRLGIRVDLRVGGELRPALAVEDVALDYSGTLNPAGPGDATVTYTVHNTGNVALSTQQAVSVTGPFGWLRADAGDVPTSPELLPGERWTVSVPVDGAFPAVRLGAEVAVTPLLTDASGSTSALDPVRATAHGWAVPWTLLAIVVLLAAGAVLVPRLVRRRRRERAEREELRVQQAVEQALGERATAGAHAGD